MGPLEGTFRRVMGPPFRSMRGATGEGGLKRFSQRHGATSDLVFAGAPRARSRDLGGASEEGACPFNHAREAPREAGCPPTAPPLDASRLREHPHPRGRSAASRPHSLQQEYATGCANVAQTDSPSGHESDSRSSFERSLRANGTLARLAGHPRSPGASRRQPRRATTRRASSDAAAGAQEQSACGEHDEGGGAAGRRGVRARIAAAAALWRGALGARVLGGALHARR